MTPETMVDLVEQRVLRVAAAALRAAAHDRTGLDEIAILKLLRDELDKLAEEARRDDSPA